MVCCGLEEAQGEFPQPRGLAELDRRSPKPSRLAREESGMPSVVCVMGTCLNTVIAIRVTQQFLKTRAIQEFFDEHLTCAVLCHSDTLDRTQRLEIKKRNSMQMHTFSITFELNF